MKNLSLVFSALSILSLSCQTADSSQINVLKTNSNFTSTTVRIFTAADLTEYLQRNSDELNKMLNGQRIMVSGVVTTLDDKYIELEGINHGKVKCSGTVFYQDEWKKLNGFFSDFNKTRAKRPLATVSGIYKSSVSPTVLLEDCKIETATK